jgi:hypothetical protein
MSAHHCFNEDIGVSWIETDGGWDVVSVDGKPADRRITKAAKGFIAWIGFMHQCWSFNGALIACADHVRMLRQMQAEADARNEAGVRSLIEMTTAQRARAIANLETERDGFDYADSEVDAVARKASIDRKIVRLREFR